jgi:exonuclease SbcD
MRIVHTSDWHAGHVWKDIPRLDELAGALEGLARFVETERVDLVLHSGDVFDASVPLGDAERVVFECLRRMGRAGARTVVIAGNHDNPTRMQAWGLLAELADVHTVPLPVPAARGGVLEVATRAGERARIAALPFASVGTLLSAAEIAATDGSAFSTYADGVRRMMQVLAGSFDPRCVNALIAHAQIEGAVIAGSERKATVGREWAATPQALPPEAHYIGLGHIHRPQRLEAAPAPAYYAGSVLQMDFAEAGEQKSFVYVEASPGRPASVRQIPYEGTAPLRRVSLSLTELHARAEELRQTGYLEITVTLDRYDPDISSKVRALVPNAVAVRQEYPTREAEEGPRRAGLGARELFELYYRQRRGADPEPRLVTAFEALHREAEARG